MREGEKKKGQNQPYVEAGEGWGSQNGIPKTRRGEAYRRMLGAARRRRTPKENGCGGRATGHRERKAE